MRTDLFCEDRAHRQFLEPLLLRVAQEEGVSTSPRIRSARGGHPRALAAFRDYQSVAAASGGPSADLVVVAIDTNCSSVAEQRKEIIRRAAPDLRDRLVLACPNPHIERWFMADPQSFSRVVGRGPDQIERKCERDHYKRVLAKAVRRAGHPPVVGGLDFAASLVAEMNLYRAGKNDPSLKSFLDELRNRLRLTVAALGSR